MLRGNMGAVGAGMRRGRSGCASPPFLLSSSLCSSSQGSEGNVLGAPRASWGEITEGAQALHSLPELGGQRECAAAWRLYPSCTAPTS